jgi:hypothetical protein
MDMDNITDNLTIILDRLYTSIPMVIFYFIIYKFLEKLLERIGKGFDLTQTIILNTVLYLLLSIINVILETFTG